jgi:thiamine biosynthesis lipoprotein
MGCEIVVGHDGDVTVVEELFRRDERIFTRFAESELLRVNRAQAPVVVSPRFARAVAAALTAWRQTEGLVDPTLLHALEAAGYDRDFAALAADAPAAAIADARAAGVHPPQAAGIDPPPAAGIGARGQAARVRIHGRILTLPPGIALDLNCVVKSMAVDDAIAVLGGPGWISAGGDLAASCPVEVALPGGGSVRLQRGGLATSGSSGRRWWRGGQLQHHLIDPRSGRPALSPWEQVTVCGASCLMADTAAKAAFLMGDAGPAWLDARAMPGRFLCADGSVVVNEAWSSGVAEAACT